MTIRVRAIPPNIRRATQGPAEDIHSQQHGAISLEGEAIKSLPSQDNVKALVWLKIAADSGDTVAITNRDVATRRMSSQQIEQSKALALECQERMSEVLRLPQCM